MRLKFLLIGIQVMLIAGATHGYASDRYAYCSSSPLYGSTSKSAYYTQIFSIPDNMQADQNGQIGHYQEPTRSFAQYLVSRYSVSERDSGNTVCNVYASLSAAQVGLSRGKTYDESTLHDRLVDVPWTLKVEGAGSASSVTEQKTEAAAVYDAEQHAQQAIPFQSGKIFYIKNWDEHSCEPHSRKTSQYAGTATVTTYTCTVKFTYSEERNPTASAALGEGATRDAAIQAAQLNHAGVTWDEPFCSETKKRAAYGSASYKVGESSASSPWYVCTIGYKAAQ